MQHDLNIYKTKFVGSICFFLEKLKNLSYIIKYLILLYWNMVFHTVSQWNIPLYVIGKVSSTIFKFFIPFFEPIFGFSFNANASYRLKRLFLWFYWRKGYSTLIHNQNFLYKWKDRYAARFKHCYFYEFQAAIFIVSHILNVSFL